MIFPVTLLLMSCMTVRSVCCSLSITTGSGACAMKCWTTIRLMRILPGSSSASPACIEAREPTLKGIITDGLPLYPDPIAKVFGKVKHQICRFHILQEITKALLQGSGKSTQRAQGKKDKASPWASFRKRGERGRTKE